MGTISDSEDENNVEQYILNDYLCMLPAEVQVIWYQNYGSVSILRNFNYSPITKHFNSHVNQGTYSHDDNTRYDNFSHRIKPLVTCKRTETDYHSSKM